jgi:hypothetical protein
VSKKIHFIGYRNNVASAVRVFLLEIEWSKYQAEADRNNAEANRLNAQAERLRQEWNITLADIKNTVIR